MVFEQIVILLNIHVRIRNYMRYVRTHAIRASSNCFVSGTGVTLYTNSMALC